MFQALVEWLPFKSIEERPSIASSIIYDRGGHELAAFVSEDGQWWFPVSSGQVSPHLLNAIVAAEDSRFYKHHGVDWKSVMGAAWQDAIHFRFVRGASTITMQVERLRHPRSRSLFNKIQQAIRAEQLERRESKDDILLEYVNRAPFGGNIVGAGAASWRYFGKPGDQLSLGEAALLAGLPQSPNRFRPDRFSDRARIRRNHVLDRMLACGFINQRQRDDAAAEAICASWRALAQDRPADSIGADGALPTLLSLAHQYSGQSLRTTIDAAVQHQIYRAVREQFESLQGSRICAAAAVVLDTQTASCLAIVSISDRDQNVDLTRRRRSTGSTLKPFIYAAAFDEGICTPSSVLLDSPAAWPGYQPNDYDRSYRGPISAAEALAESRNIPAMLVLSKLGVEQATAMLDAAGVHGPARDPSRYGLTLAIGGAEGSPVEMAEAYAAIGRGGVALPVRFISDEPDVGGRGSCRAESLPGGEARLARSLALPSTCGTPSSTRFLRANVCWQTLHALSGIDRTAAICPAAAHSHVAWKTGTSSGHRDAWCAAVTRRYTVIVWFGNARGEASADLVGQETAAPAALRLIALLDPADEPWPASIEPAPSSSQQPQLRANGLIICSPSPDERIVLSADVPRSRQRVALQAASRAVSAGASERLWWFIDDHLLAQSDLSERIWWDPSPGTHQIRVVDQHAHSAVVTLAVR